MVVRGGEGVDPQILFFLNNSLRNYFQRKCQERKVIRHEISQDTTHMLAQTSYKSRKFPSKGKKITIFDI